MAEKVRIQSGRQRRLSQLEEQAGKVAPSGIYIAQVREVKDTNKMGIIRVHVEGTQRPDVPAEWATVQYASPFAGAISQDEAEGKSVIFDADANDYSQVFTSYGMWFPQVKINNKVLVFFAENDFEKGYYFANCLPDYQYSTLPGLASSKKKSGSSLAVTAAAIAAAQGLGGASGSSNGHVVGSERGIVMPGQVQPGVEGDTSGAERVEHPLTDALKAQGLDKDHIRGHSSSSARRDLTSKCFGILTPGQHQFVMDDDADQPLIRLRTSNGSQILINDAGDGVIYFITKKGKSWLEMHGDGTIDVFSAKDISFTAENNINFYAQKEININSNQDLNMVATTGNIQLETKQKDLMLLAQGSTKIGSGTKTIELQCPANIVLAGAKVDLMPASPPGGKIEPLEPTNLPGDQGSAYVKRLPEQEPWKGHVDLGEEAMVLDGWT